MNSFYVLLILKENESKLQLLFRQSQSPEYYREQLFLLSAALYNAFENSGKLCVCVCFILIIFPYVTN